MSVRERQSHSVERDGLLRVVRLGLAAGAGIVAASLAEAGHDPSGGSLMIPHGQAALVVGGAVALGLLGTLLPPR